MDKISIKMSDISGRTGDVSKAGTASGNTKAVTDDFKKLLQDQGQREDGKEVSEDTKAEKKPENPKNEKDTKDVKDTKDDTVKDESKKEDKSKTENLLAAYQMSQGFRPEVIQAEPEAAEEVVMPEIQLVEETKSTEVFVQATDTEEPAVQLVGETLAEPAKKVETEVPKEAEAAETEMMKEEVKAEAAKEDETSSGSQQRDMTQGSSHMAEQVQVTSEPQTAAQVYEPKQQEPVRMHVPQPEALPEKLTDQLMTKISEGVQEFEIHIEPANLGKIAVKILYQEGQATVSILCSEKKTLDVLGRNAGEIGQVIDKNLGGTTTIIVEKPESDYLNQTRDENQKNGQNAEQDEQKNGKKDHDAEDAEQFLQKLRLGLTV